MMTPRFLSLSLLGAALWLPAAATAQTFDLPSSIPVPANNNFPFAGPIMRYQQWYSAAEWIAQVKHPVRVNGIWFQKGTGNGNTPGTVTLEVRIANGPTLSPSVTFDNNLVAGETILAPRQTITIPASAPGSFPVRFSTPNEFIWDGESGVTVEVRVFGNGNQNKAFNYDFTSTATSGGRVYRLFTIGNANATTAVNFQRGWGLLTRFLFNEGVTVPYGDGCPGGGNFVPFASTAGGWPLPGNGNFEQVLTKANSQRPAAWLLGSSRDKWGSLQLPLDLQIIGANGCSLLAEPLVSFGVTTVGGGPGQGTARLRTPILPIPFVPQTHLFAQWLVLDNAASNGFLAVSNGVWILFP